MTQKELEEACEMLETSGAKIIRRILSQSSGWLVCAKYSNNAEKTYWTLAGVNDICDLVKELAIMQSP